MKFCLTKSLTVLSILICSFSVFTNDKITTEEIITKHLESIGATESRNATKSIIAVGDVSVTLVSTKNLPSQGRIVLASDGRKIFWGFNLNVNEYPFERFSFDGNVTKVAFVRPGFRSILGNFVVSNKVIIEQSLLSGTLSTSWGLLNLEANKAKILFEGTKKIDGIETYVLGYYPKGGSDIDIKLFFDKTTFQHLRTEYKRTSSAGIGRTPEQSSRFSESRLKLVEKFSDFKKVNNLMMPHNYILNYSASGQNITTEIEWKINLSEFAFNQKLAETTFDAEAN